MKKNLMKVCMKLKQPLFISIFLFKGKEFYFDQKIIFSFIQQSFYQNLTESCFIYPLTKKVNSPFNAEKIVKKAQSKKYANEISAENSFYKQTEIDVKHKFRFSKMTPNHNSIFAEYFSNTSAPNFSGLQDLNPDSEVTDVYKTHRYKLFSEMLVFERLMLLYVNTADVQYKFARKKNGLQSGHEPRRSSTKASKYIQSSYKNWRVRETNFVENDAWKCFVHVYQ